MGSVKTTDLLWKGFFRDRSLWYGNRANKNSRSPDFQHVITRESLWIDGCNNPSWVAEELRKAANRLPSPMEANEIHDKKIMYENHHGNYVLVSLLKSYAKNKDIYEGFKLHADIIRRGLLENNPYLASSLINMYVKCEALGKAQQVFEELSVRDVISWNTMIAGCTQQGQHHKALNFFDCMQYEGIFPDVVTFTCILKATGSIGAIDKGKQIHDKIIADGLLDKDVLLGTALVDMYAKCGLLAEAQEVLESLPVRDVVSWSALLAGYTEQGQYQEALNCYEKMRGNNLSPDMVAFISILKVFGNIRAVDRGKQIHDEIVGKGMLHQDITLGNALLDMYTKCDMIHNAEEIFEEIYTRDVVSWNTIIGWYGIQGQGHEAFNYFQRMQSEGFSPDVVTFSCILKACGCLGTIDVGRKLHQEIMSKGLLKDDIVLGNALVDMYAKCGFMEKAHQVLEELPIQNIVSWNTLVAGYAQQGLCEDAVKCFDNLQIRGLYPDAVTFVCILKAFGSTKAVKNCRDIHGEIVNRGFLLEDIMLGTALVDMYAICGVFTVAQQVLKELPVKSIVAWNTLISRYMQQGRSNEAISCFEGMKKEGFIPDAITFLSVLKACSDRRAINVGKQIHNEIISGNLLEKNVALGNALVHMYTKCGWLDKALDVLEELPIRDVVSWSIVISGYAEVGDGYEALNCVERMQSEGYSPDSFTLTCILKACGDVEDVFKGKQIHDGFVSSTLLEKDVVLGNALVDMYSKCGFLSKAQEVLEGLPNRDVVSWNVLIGGYVRQGQGNEAFQCFHRMKHQGISPDEVSFTWALKACGSMGASDLGKQIHDEIVSRGLNKDTVLGNALVDMYSRCHMLSKAREVLDELPARNVASWNTLIAGYAQERRGYEALDSFRRMQNEGLSPDQITLLSVLVACNHSGLLAEAQILFGYMNTKYGITPNVDHQTCMVFGFGQAGHFDKAMSVINLMPSFEHPVLWLALLAACRKWGNLELGMLAFDQLLQQDKGFNKAFVFMSNIFVSAGMHEDAERVEAIRLRYVN